jgi:Tol biopolymer transport system component
MARTYLGDPKRASRIYLTARSEDGKDNAISLFAIDPETGEWSKVLDRCDIRPRISPDGRTIAFRNDNALWTRSVAGGDDPKRILDLEGAPTGEPIWSGDAKEIIISPGVRSPDNEHWIFKTLRFVADGSRRQTLKIVPEDSVQDWSADGQWIVVASSRNAKIGWQLYVMHPDGTGERQVTEGGNPFYTRFAPDSRRLLYSDGTTEERRGAWLVGIDGKGRRRIFPTGTDQASACWSRDGTRIAIGIRSFEPVPGDFRGTARLEVMDLDGEHRTSFSLPSGSNPDMPDWR